MFGVEGFTVLGVWGTTISVHWTLEVLGLELQRVTFRAYREGSGFEAFEEDLRGDGCRPSQKALLRFKNGRCKIGKLMTDDRGDPPARNENPKPYTRLPEARTGPQTPKPHSLNTCWLAHIFVRGKVCGLGLG